MSREEVIARVLAYVHENGVAPGGAEVGRWMGKTRQSGARLLSSLRDRIDAALAANPDERALVNFDSPVDDAREAIRAA